MIRTSGEEQGGRRYIVVILNNKRLWGEDTKELNVMMYSRSKQGMRVC